MSSPSPEFDEQMMRRAIRLAMNGRGRVEPNPMVGCVIVKDGRVIGEEFHAQFGGPHAEPAALAACTEWPAGATAYVTLEPCCHTNKKTPPCAPRLIEANVARVVVGCLDPNPQVNGQGLATLRSAGIEVAGPVLEASAKQLIAPFLVRVNYNRPYVTLKWAESANGKVAGPGGRPVRISNERSINLIHQLRGRSDGIVVGINTVLSDDPTLTARGVDHARRLVRYVLDSDVRLPLNSKLVQTARHTAVVVYSFHRGLGTAHAEALRGCGVDIIDLDPIGLARQNSDERLSLSEMLLTQDQVTHLLVEPGPTLAAGFFDQRVGDRIWVIRSQDQIDAADAPSAALIPQHYLKVGQLDLAGDILTEYVNTESDAFFAAEPSADFHLAKAAHR